jgi:hypothetical protein
MVPLTSLVAAGVVAALAPEVADVVAWPGALVLLNEEYVAADGGDMPVIAIFNSLTRGSTGL